MMFLPITNMKKSMKVTKFVVSAAMIFSAVTSHAELFEYSYTFGDDAVAWGNSFGEGTVLSGSFDGSASGNLVTNLSNISASVNGVALQGSGNLFAAFRDERGFWVPGAAQVSFDGFENNFYFTDIQTNSGRPNVGVEFLSRNDWANVYRWDPQAQLYETGGTASRWSLSSVSAVPEPETYALMLAGLGMLLAIARRRTSKQG